MNKKLIETNIDQYDLKEGECTLVINTMIYAPDNYYEPIAVELLHNYKPLDNLTLNHRYPNGHYVTPSRRYGHKISKYGYPIVMSIADSFKQQSVGIYVQYGAYNELIHIPIQMSIREGKPYTHLTIKIDTVSGRIYLRTIDANNRIISWSNQPQDKDQLLEIDDESSVGVVYKNIIPLVGRTFEDIKDLSSF